MRHILTLTRMPVKAQTDICDNISSDFQAQLCFLYHVLVDFFVPILELKNPDTSAQE